MTNLSQKDPRWASLPLGHSNVTIAGYGCTITSLAMYLGTTPDVVNERLKAVGGFLNGNLVIWAKVKEAFPGVEITKIGIPYDNDDVAANLPCLVEVDFDGTERVDNRHWVVYIGNQQMLDPDTGRVESTSKYKALSYRLIKGTWNKEQIVAPIANEGDYFEMDGLKANYADRASMFETFKVWVALQQGKLIDKAKIIAPEVFQQQVDATSQCITQLQSANGTVTELQGQLEEVRTKKETIQKEVDDLKSKLNDAERSIVDLKREISETNGQDADYGQKYLDADKLNKNLASDVEMLTEAANLETKFDSAPLHEKALAVAKKIIQLQEENEGLHKLATPSQEGPSPAITGPISADTSNDDQHKSSNIFITVWRLFFQ